MKTYNEYLGMSAEQLLADPEAPESLKIAARLRWQSWLNIIIRTVRYA